MGNKNSKAGVLHEKGKAASRKFDADELHVLQQTWRDLADRSNGLGIEKETFLQYFPLNGLLGERLFSAFDTKKSGYIDFDEFVVGLADIARGTVDAKIHFLFNMCDILDENTVSREELETLLNQVPVEILHHRMNNEYAEEDIEMKSEQSSSNKDIVTGSEVPLNPTEISKSGQANTDTEGKIVNNNKKSDIIEEVENEDDRDQSLDDDSSFEEEVDAYTNHDIVIKAFEDCDVEHDGRLTFEEFKMWIERTPEVLEYIESIFPYTSRKVGDNVTHKDHNEILPLNSKKPMHGLRKTHSINSLQDHYDLSQNDESGSSSNKHPAFTRLVRSNSVMKSQEEDGGNLHTSISGSGLSHSSSTGDSKTDMSLIHIKGAVPAIPVLRDDKANAEQVTRAYLEAAAVTTQDNELSQAIRELLEWQHYHEADEHLLEGMDFEGKPVVALEGYLFKKGIHFHLWSKRYYILSGTCVYYYSNQQDVRPKGVIFLTGSIIEKISDPVQEGKGYYGFEITHMNMCTGEHHRHDKRILWHRSEEDRDVWVHKLQEAAHVVPITDDYVVGSELGRGRFSVVHECVNKQTKEHMAVKIIDKSTVKSEEKVLLRTEIAVLKLMDHPHIIRMHGLYETKDKIYIVMEMLKGGELFERIVGRPRFNEEDTAKLLRPLLESVAYMHDLGIVHRDLKPENILCGENLEDLKIADFGLSKMIMPTEKMEQACGTLSYVAPEVLTNKGYGKEADLWSVGVIMFLLLCGKLPFDGENAEDIIK